MRDWLIVTRRVPDAVKAQRLAVKREQHRTATWLERIYPRARCEYAAVLRSRGMTYRQIGLRFGVSISMANILVRRWYNIYQGK